MSGFGKRVLEDLQKLHDQELAQLEPQLGAGSMPAAATSQLDLKQNIRSRLIRDFMRLFPIGDYKDSEDYEFVADMLESMKVSDLQPTTRAEEALTVIDETEKPADYVRGENYVPEPQPPFTTQDEIEKFKEAVLHNFKMDFKNGYAHNLYTVVEYCLDYANIRELNSFMNAVEAAHAENTEHLITLNELLQDEKNIEALESLTSKSFHESKDTLKLAKYLNSFSKKETAENLETISYLIDKLYFGYNHALATISRDKHNITTLDWITRIYKFKDTVLIPISQTKAMQDFFVKQDKYEMLSKHVQQFSNQSKTQYFLELPEVPRSDKKTRRKPG